MSDGTFRTIVWLMLCLILGVTLGTAIALKGIYHDVHEMHALDSEGSRSVTK